MSGRYGKLYESEVGGSRGFDMPPSHKGSRNKAKMYAQPKKPKKTKQQTKSNANASSLARLQELHAPDPAEQPGPHGGSKLPAMAAGSKAAGPYVGITPEGPRRSNGKGAAANRNMAGELEDMFRRTMPAESEMQSPLVHGPPDRSAEPIAPRAQRNGVKPSDALANRLRGEAEALDAQMVRLRQTNKNKLSNKLPALSPSSRATSSPLSQPLPHVSGSKTERQRDKAAPRAAGGAATATNDGSHGRHDRRNDAKTDTKLGAIKLERSFKMLRPQNSEAVETPAADVQRSEPSVSAVRHSVMEQELEAAATRGGLAAPVNRHALQQPLEPMSTPAGHKRTNNSNGGQKKSAVMLAEPSEREVLLQKNNCSATVLSFSVMRSDSSSGVTRPMQSHGPPISSKTPEVAHQAMPGAPPPRLQPQPLERPPVKSAHKSVRNMWKQQTGAASSKSAEDQPQSQHQAAAAVRPVKEDAHTESLLPELTPRANCSGSMRHETLPTIATGQAPTATTRLANQASHLPSPTSVLDISNEMDQHSATSSQRGDSHSAACDRPSPAAASQGMGAEAPGRQLPDIALPAAGSGRRPSSARQQQQGAKKSELLAAHKSRKTMPVRPEGLDSLNAYDHLMASALAAQTAASVYKENMQRAVRMQAKAKANSKPPQNDKKNSKNRKKGARLAVQI